MTNRRSVTRPQLGYKYKM